MTHLSPFELKYLLLTTTPRHIDVVVVGGLISIDDILIDNVSWTSNVMIVFISFLLSIV